MFSMRHTFIAVVCMLCSLPVSGARLVGPPLSELSGRWNQVMAATLIARQAPDQLQFQCLQVLHGEPARRITLAVDASVFAQLSVDQNYVVAYTASMQHPQYREMRVQIPDGPKVLQIKGVTLSAVFADHPGLRQLVLAAPDSHHTLATLLALMGSTDPGTRLLASAEIFARPGLHALFTAADARVFQANAQADIMRGEALQIALHAAARIPAIAEQSWLMALRRSVIRGAPVRMALASPQPLLVRTALLGLAPQASQHDAVSARALLVSNAPGVAKAALRVLVEIDPAQARNAAQVALRETNLHSEIRRALGAYLRRGELPDAG